MCMRDLQEFLGARLPESVTIVEVGPRDGLQNEKQTVLSSLARLLFEASLGARTLISAWVICKHVGHGSLAACSACLSMFPPMECCYRADACAKSCRYPLM